MIAIIGILAALLSPALKAARDSARSIQCLNNLRQTHLALMSYARDFDDWIVPFYNRYPNFWDGTIEWRPWYELLGSYGTGHYGKLNYGVQLMAPAYAGWSNGPLMSCSAEKRTDFAYSHYTCNADLFGWEASGWPAPNRFLQINNPTITVMVTDNSRVDSFISGNCIGMNVAFRHMGNANVLYADGHVAAKTAAQLTYSSFFDGYTYSVSP